MALACQCRPLQGLLLQEPRQRKHAAPPGALPSLLSSAFLPSKRITTTRRTSQAGDSKTGKARATPQARGGTGGSEHGGAQLELAQPARHSTQDAALPRRQALLTAAAAAAAAILAPSTPASAAPAFLEQGLNKYIKKKKLDPLETFVPTVLITASQIRTVQAVIAKEDSTAEDILNARYLLRTGAAASLRSDLRAIAQYGEEASPGSGLKADAEQCLEDLGFLDSAMRLEKESSSGGRGRMLAYAGSAIARLDRVLGSVPDDVMARSKAVVGGGAAAPAAPSGPSEVEAAGNGAGVEGSAGSGSESEGGLVEGFREGEGEPGMEEDGKDTASGDAPKTITLKKKKSDAELLESIL